MPKSKKMQKMSEKVDAKKLYPIGEATVLVKETSAAKFDASVEMHLRLGIDISKSDQQIRGTVLLPNGTGKTRRVAAFVPPEKENDAKAAGADIVGGEELINSLISSEKIDFDVAVATPSMMPKLAKAAKLLGPKGLMPNPKTETVSENISKIITEQKGGKVSFKNDNGGNVHQIIGKVSFDAVKLEENARALIEAIKKVKPSSAKGIYIQNAVITSTMGPAINLEIETE